MKYNRNQKGQFQSANKEPDKEYQQYYKVRFNKPDEPEQIPKWIVLIPFILAILLIILYHYSG